MTTFVPNAKFSWLDTIALVVLMVSLFGLQARRNLKADVINSTTATPNIIIILLDDLGWNDIGFHNSSKLLTPHMDDLASNGLILNHFYTQHTCTPTRSSLMSGRYPIHNGLQNEVIKATVPYGLSLDDPIITNELKRLNYNTYMIGKWHLGFYSEDYTPPSRDFDYFVGIYLSSGDHYDHWETTRNFTGYDLRNHTEAIRRDGLYSTFLYGNTTMDVLQYEVNVNKKEQPFFIYLSFQAPHSPLQAPPYYCALYNDSDMHIGSEERKIAGGMVTCLDDTIYEITSYLKDSGMWDDTLIFVFADNGGGGGAASSNYPLRGAKTTLWEGGIRATAFVSGGYLNDDRRGEICNELMHVTDIYPTITSMLGLTPLNESKLDGVDQWDVIQNGGSTTREEILHNIDPVDCEQEICGAIRMGKWKLVIGKEVMDTENSLSGWETSSRSREDPSVTCGGDPPVFNTSDALCPWNGEACLFDVENDPCEYEDVAALYPAIKQQLWDRLLQFNASMVTPLSETTRGESRLADPRNHGGFWSSWR